MSKTQHRPVRTIIEADISCLDCGRVKTAVVALGVYDGEKYRCCCTCGGSKLCIAVTGMRHRVLPLPIWEATALGRPA